MWAAIKIIWNGMPLGFKVTAGLLLFSVIALGFQEVQKFRLRSDIADLNNTLGIQKQLLADTQAERNTLLLAVQRQNDAIKGMQREGELAGAKAAQRGLSSLLASQATINEAATLKGSGPAVMNQWQHKVLGGQP